MFVDCNVFVYCIIFFAWIFKVPTPETLRFGFKGVEGRALAYNYALQVFFIFIFLFFQTWRIVAGKLKKLNNFETGLKLSQYFDPSWSRSGPIFVGAVLVAAAQTETDVGFTLYIKNSWPQYSNDLQGRA